MKKAAALFIALMVIFSLTACGENEDASEPAEIEGCEVSMIADSNEVESGSFTEKVWESVSQYALENSLGSECFKPEDSTKKAYMNAIDTAVQQGAKLIVLPGSCFEETAYEAQKEYSDIYFLILDGIPHNDDNKYKTGAKTIGVVFAEEEAGYLAGYAAVKDGYSSLGFIGSEKTPEIKRYGYGFVQGASAAAEENETKIKLKYIYESKAENTEKQADEWYKEGVETIFACGSDTDTAVIKAAEANSGKVICADSDKSYMSETVVTSAEKGVGAAVEDAIDGYSDDNFIGGTAFNYAVKNNGIMLEMKNARFTSFDEEQYNAVMNRLKDGKVKLKKDENVKMVNEFENKWISID